MWSYDATDCDPPAPTLLMSPAMVAAAVTDVRGFLDD